MENQQLMCLRILFLSLRIAIVVSSSALVAQVNYDEGSNSYILKLPFGTPQQTQLLTLDVESPVTALSCGNKGSFQPSLSSTFHKLSCGGSSSSSAKYSCGLAEESVTINTTDGTTPLKPFTVTGVDFKCVPSKANGSSSSAISVAALSSGKLALPAQITENAGLARKFAYCLPSSTSSPGTVFFGSSNSYIFQSGPPVNVSSVLSHTTLHTNTDGSYAISVQNIAVSFVSQKTLNFKKPLKLRISTVQPYTKLQRSVYKALRSTFRQQISYGNLTAAAPAVAPFDTCFNATKFYSTRAGPGVPQINLQMSDGAVWSIFGLNSVVSVSDSVLCFAFVDAGIRQPSVLGTFQQHDNFLEFDLKHSVLGFSGLLDFYRTVCADFLF